MSVLAQTAQTIKHHVPLWPLVGFVAAGMGLAGFALIRLAIHNPEVVINHKSNPHPWEKVKPHTVIKFFDVIDRGSGEKFKDQLNEKPKY